jgi:hypothetical protein
VLRARGRGVGDRRRLRHADADHAARRARVAGAHAHQDADGAGAHEVQRGLVGRAAADDDRKLERPDELFQVQGLAVRGDVLGRHDGALDH